VRKALTSHDSPHVATGRQKYIFPLMKPLLLALIVAAVAASPLRAQHHDHAMSIPAGAGFTEADVHFMQHMIGHHAQAIRMAELAPTHGASAAVLALAKKIDISQRDEIGLMTRWLTERKQPAPAPDDTLAMMMPGMLTPAQFALLRNARGAEFDRLFLSFMIRHHQGALQMVDELFDTKNAAQDSDLFRFATDVGTDQRDEIYVMEGLLVNIKPDE